MKWVSQLLKIKVKGGFCQEIKCSGKTCSPTRKHHKCIRRMDERPFWGGKDYTTISNLQTFSRKRQIEKGGEKGKKRKFNTFFREVGYCQLARWPYQRISAGIPETIYSGWFCRDPLAYGRLFLLPPWRARREPGERDECQRVWERRRNPQGVSAGRPL